MMFLGYLVLMDLGVAMIYITRVPYIHKPIPAAASNPPTRAALPILRFPAPPVSAAASEDVVLAGPSQCQWSP